MTKKDWGLLAVPLVALFTVVARIYAVLPAVMQDEYVYSTQSRFVPFAEQTFPNYLYSWVYSSTSMCGEGYYDCAKNLNILFFVVLLVFVYLIAARLIGRNYAVIVCTLTALSPLSVSTSFFMPEIMYFAFMAGTVWLLLLAAKRGVWFWWLFGALALGLTTLVKPHALFAVPVVVVFVYFATLRSEAGSVVKSLLNSGVALFGVLAAKFGLGFVFAGVAGLTLFGTGYTDSVSNFVNTASTPVSLPQAFGSVVVLAESTGGNMWSVLTSTAFLQLAMHLSLLLLLWGIPFMLSVSVIKNVLFKKDVVSELGAFVSLTGGLALSYVVVVSVFEGFVTAGGDDHTQRIITRYYDFLLPLLLILVFAIEKYVEPKLWVRWVQSGLVLAAVVYAFVWFPTGVVTRFSDSVPTMGLVYYPAVLYIVGVIVLAGQFIWLAKPEYGARLVARALVPLIVVILGFSSVGALHQKIGTTKGYFDVAGQTAKPLLAGVPGDRIGVVGAVRPEVFTAKFWIDKPYIKDVLVGADGKLTMEMLAGLDYALFLGTSEGIGVGSVVTSGNNFVLVKLQ